METIYEPSIRVILWLQSLGPWLIPPMKYLSFLISEYFFILVIPVIYWCISSSAGLELGLMLMISNSLKAPFKNLFHEPRPFWIDTRVKASYVETSFGIPSGHAMDSVILFGVLAAYIKKTWAWVVVVIMIFLIGLSRLVLGVHFPTDVLGGWLIGVIFLCVWYACRKPASAWINQQKQVVLYSLAFLLSVAFIAFSYFSLALLSGWSAPEEWIRNAAIAFPDIPFNPLSITGTINSAAAFFGIAAGAILLKSRGGFDVSGPTWQRVVRFFVGLVGLLVIYFVLDMLFPEGETLVPLAFRYIRYAMVGFWIAGLAPWVFWQLKLANKPT